eukprot:900915-Pyramimonas_sp.AAC.1
MAVRVWPRTRSGVVDAWAHQLEDHWGTAVIGSSALRAVLYARHFTGQGKPWESHAQNSPPTWGNFMIP